MEVFERKSAACQAALDRLADDLERAAPDVVVIVTDDQAELFQQTNLPALSIFYGEALKTIPRANVNHLRHMVSEPFFKYMAESYAMDKVRTFPGHAKFARELIELNLDADDKVTAIRKLAELVVAAGRGTDVDTIVKDVLARDEMGTPQVGGSPAGLVDAETVARLWAALERAGKANDVRKALLDVTMIRR